MSCGYDECGMDCAPGCGGCSGSCDSSCDGSCDGGCTGDCDGCDGCDNACDGCYGSCSGHCDNGCTATSMANFYNGLGTNIAINAIIRAADIKDIQTAVQRELNRRSKSAASSTVVPGGLMKGEVRDKIRSNLLQVGFDRNKPTYPYASAAEFQTYVSYIKELYRQILRG